MNTEQKIEAEAYAITEWAVESKDNDIFKVITESFIAGRSKGLEREKEYRDVLKELLKWCPPHDSWNLMSAIEHAQQLLNK